MLDVKGCWAPCGSESLEGKNKGSTKAVRDGHQASLSSSSVRFRMWTEGVEEKTEKEKGRRDLAKSVEERTEVQGKGDPLY